MGEKRGASRRRVLKGAFIVLSEKAPKLPCVVKNISDTGAAVEVSTTVGIPHSFELIVDGARHQCQAQWRTQTRIGVKFE